MPGKYFANWCWKARCETYKHTFMDCHKLYFLYPNYVNTILSVRGWRDREFSVHMMQIVSPKKGGLLFHYNRLQMNK